MSAKAGIPRRHFRVVQAMQPVSPITDAQNFRKTEINCARKTDI
jgi:hypothetical protein